MDPLIEAHVYNVDHSPINRLPDGLVLYILRCLGDDLLTMLCLRRMARRIRQIINEPETWKVMCVNLSLSSSYLSEEVVCFPKDLREELWRRIQKDGICDECMLRRPGVPDKGGWLRRYNPGAGWLQRPSECPVMSSSPLGFYYNGNNSGHDTLEFCPPTGGISIEWRSISA
jgi:hypothetical protein